MQWLAENWLLLLLVGGMAAMHLFGHGHGGHGGHGGHAHRRGPSDDPAKPGDSVDARADSDSDDGHDGRGAA